MHQFVFRRVSYRANRYQNVHKCLHRIKHVASRATALATHAHNLYLLRIPEYNHRCALYIRLLVFANCFIHRHSLFDKLIACSSKVRWKKSEMFPVLLMERSGSSIEIFEQEIPYVKIMKTGVTSCSPRVRTCHEKSFLLF